MNLLAVRENIATRSGGKMLFNKQINISVKHYEIYQTQLQNECFISVIEWVNIAKRHISNFAAICDDFSGEVEGTKR